MGLTSDIERDLGRYNVRSSLYARFPGFLKILTAFFVLPGFRASLLYRLSNRLYKKKWRLAAGFTSRMIRTLCGIEICVTAEIGPGVSFPHPMGIVIGGNSKMGSDCVIMQGVTLGQKGDFRDESGQSQPTAGNGVFFGAGAKVLGPVKIGDNAMIGANAVVLVDVPEGATAVGIPARIIKKNPEK